MSDAVLVALITGGFGLIGSMVALLAKANRREHGENGHKLDLLLKGHERIESKVDTHINDHARGDV